MAVVVSGSPGPDGGVRVGISPLAELGAALHRLTGLDHAGNEWSVRVWSALPAALRRECEVFSACWGGYRSRLLLPVTLPSRPSFPAELGAVESTSDGDFAALTGYALCGIGDGVDLTGLLTDGELRSWLRVQARGRGGERAVTLLLDDLPAFRRRFLAVLADCWDAFFATMWAEYGPALAARAAADRTRVDRDGPLPGLAALVPSARLLDDPPRLRLDKLHHGTVDLAVTPLLLVPTELGAPHVLVKHEAGRPAVLQYPSSADRSVPTDLVQRRLRLLADPTKARLCRAIARHRRSTRELAGSFGLGAPEVSRHLRALREAGLAETERDGHFVYYTLRLDEVERLGQDVVAALLR